MKKKRTKSFSYRALLIPLDCFSFQLQTEEKIIKTSRHAKLKSRPDLNVRLNRHSLYIGRNLARTSCIKSPGPRKTLKKEEVILIERNKQENAAGRQWTVMREIAHSETVEDSSSGKKKELKVRGFTLIFSKEISLYHLFFYIVFFFFSNSSLFLFVLFLILFIITFFLFL